MNGQFPLLIATLSLLCISDDPKIRYNRDLEKELGSGITPGLNNNEKYIETLVVVDPKMCNFHGEDAVKQYALSACNIVSPSLLARVF